MQMTGTLGRIGQPLRHIGGRVGAAGDIHIEPVHRQGGHLHARTQMGRDHRHQRERLGSEIPQSLSRRQRRLQACLALAFSDLGRDALLPCVDLPLGRQRALVQMARELLQARRREERQHQQHSGVPQVYFDEATKQKVVPHVIEPAVGVDRILLAVLCAGYAEEDVTDDKGNVEKRTVLRLSPRIAPVKVAVLPLLKNKEALVARARELHAKLKRNYAVFYDEGGAIGRRYRRQDEIGTPWCVTIDFETIE